MAPGMFWATAADWPLYATVGTTRVLNEVAKFSENWRTAAPMASPLTFPGPHWGKLAPPPRPPVLAAFRVAVLSPAWTNPAVSHGLFTWTGKEPETEIAERSGSGDPDPPSAAALARTFVMRRIRYCPGAGVSNGTP